MKERRAQRSRIILGAASWMVSIGLSGWFVGVVAHIILMRALKRNKYRVTDIVCGGNALHVQPKILYFFLFQHKPLAPHSATNEQKLPNEAVSATTTWRPVGFGFTAANKKKSNLKPVFTSCVLVGSLQCNTKYI